MFVVVVVVEFVDVDVVVVAWVLVFCLVRNTP